MKKIQTLCVYCGSSIGASPLYVNAAKELATVMVENDIALVYGGGHVGLMGTIADAVLAASIFHYGEFTVGQAKQHMAGRGIPVRL